MKEPNKNVSVHVQDGVFQASRITGPKHIFLRLAFCDRQPRVLQLTKLQLKDDTAAPEINEAKLLAAVLEGVAAANRQIGSDLQVERIEYVPTDTPDYCMYSDLANTISVFAAASRAS